MTLKKEILNPLMLLIGAIGIMFAGINWYNGFSAWLAPIFLLWYTRNSSWKGMIWFFFIISVAGIFSQTSNNIMNLPSVHIFNGLSFGILTIVPYIIDKLLYQKKKPFHYTLIFPATITLIEFIASKAIGTWGSMAHTQYEFKSFIQVISITGIYGIWFIIAWFASIVNWIIENGFNKKFVKKAAFIFGAIFLIINIFGYIKYYKTNNNLDSVKVAAIISETDIHEIMSKESELFEKLSQNQQYNIPPQIFSDSSTIKNLISNTKNAISEGAKIITWNEIALVINQNQKKKLITTIQNLCSEDKTYLLASFLEYCEDSTKRPFNNIAILTAPNGRTIWEYKKSFLQPTAEAPIVNAGNFDLPVINTPFGNLGCVICADLDMTNYIKQTSEKNIDILLVPAFDWPEITPLHAQMGSVQAIQFGFYLIRPNGKGLVTMYNPHGKLIKSLNTLKSQNKYLVAQLPVETLQTVYSKTGDILILASLIFLVFIIIIRFIKGKN